MQITPVASASPNGNVRIARRYRWIHPTELRNIEDAEDRARRQPIYRLEAQEYVRWHNFVAALAGDDSNLFHEEIETISTPVTIGSRRAVIEEFGECLIHIRSGYGRSARSRSHSRSKGSRRNSGWHDTF